MKEEFDVDIVIPWVDGSDKKWQEEKNKYLPDEKKINIDAAANRYRDWDNLQYVFRSIEKFAPWVRKVFLITCGQKPKWLNEKCEKLMFVEHKDYIPKEYLPTFSANPIELNLHRIEGLSEHFVYMNDDFFFTNNVLKEDFFKNGLPKIVAIEKANSVGKDMVFENILANNIRLIGKVFNKKDTKKKLKKKFYGICRFKESITNKIFDFVGKDGWVGFYYDHLPAPILKSSIEQCWRIFSEKLDATSKNKFRSIYDVNQYLFTEFMICSGNFEPAKYGQKGRLLNIDDENYVQLEGFCEEIKNQKYKMICINDDKVLNFEETKNKINQALDSILPEKSSFEL